MSYKRFAPLVIPYLLLVGIQISSGLFRQIPVVFADELGYIGNAWYLSGAFPMPNLQGCTFYHPGYSLFIIPAFWISHDPFLSYKLVILINSLIMSALYFPLYYTLHHTFGTSARRSAVIAFVTCLYPAYIVQAKLAWAENALIPLHAMLIVAFGILIERKTYGWAVLFGFLAGFVYTVHPRALPLIPICTLFLLFLWWQKILSLSRIAAAIAVCLAVFYATAQLNNHLQTLGWGGGTLIPFSSKDVLQYWFSTKGFTQYLQVVSGHTLYLLQSSYGLVYLGFLFIVLQVRSKFPDQNPVRQKSKKILMGFILFASIVVALGIQVKLSYAFSHEGFTSADFHVYGRYNEAFIAFYIAFGLLFLTTGFSTFRHRRYTVLIFVLILSSLTPIVPAKRGSDLFVGPIALANITGIYPAIHFLKLRHVHFISLGAAILFFILILLRGKPRTAILVVTVAFLTVGLYNVKELLAGQKHMMGWNLVPSFVKNSGPLESLSYDMAYYKQRHYFLYQYLLSSTRFDRFSSRKGERPNSSVVISGKSWKQAEELGAQIVSPKRRGNPVIWFLPEKVDDLVQDVSFMNRDLGNQRVFGVWESGFIRQESKKHRLARFINESAKLIIPVATTEKPETIQFNLRAARRTVIRIFINEQQIHSGEHQGKFERTFDITALPITDRITVEILTASPNPVEEGNTIQVLVNAIRVGSAKQQE